MAESQQDQNLKAAGAYLLWFITGIIILIAEKHSRFVRFHAMQSIITFGGFVLLYWFIDFLQVFDFLRPVLNLSALILWVLLLVKSYQGQYFKLPYIGDLAEKQLSKV